MPNLSVYLTISTTHFPRYPLIGDSFILCIFFPSKKQTWRLIRQTKKCAVNHCMDGEAIRRYARPPSLSSTMTLLFVFCNSDDQNWCLRTSVWWRSSLFKLTSTILSVGNKRSYHSVVNSSSKLTTFHTVWLIYNMNSWICISTFSPRTILMLRWQLERLNSNTNVVSTRICKYFLNLYGFLIEILLLFHAKTLLF